MSQSNFVDFRHKWVKWCNFKKKQLVFASVLYLHFNFLKQIKPVIYNFYVFEILRCESDMEKMPDILVQYILDVLMLSNGVNLFNSQLFMIVDLVLCSFRN